MATRPKRPSRINGGSAARRGKPPAMERKEVVAELRAMEQAAAVLLGNHPSSPTTVADFNRIRGRIMERLTAVRPLADRHGLVVPHLVVRLVAMQPVPGGLNEAEYELETMLDRAGL